MTRITRPAVALTTAFLFMSGCDPTISDLDIRYAEIGEVRSLMGADTANNGAESGRVLLIDARSKKAHEAGHLPGSINVQLFELEREAGLSKKWKQYDEIIVYGDDPGSTPARAVTKRLLEIGYSDVRLFKGGASEWKKGGFPIVTGEK